MNQSKRRFSAVRGFACCCIWLLLSAPALCAQDFSSVDADLSQLETLIADMLINTEEQLKQLDDLKRNLNESAQSAARIALEFRGFWWTTPCYQTARNF